MHYAGKTLTNFNTKKIFTALKVSTLITSSPSPLKTHKKESRTHNPLWWPATNPPWTLL